MLCSVGTRKVVRYVGRFVLLLLVLVVRAVVMS